MSDRETGSIRIPIEEKGLTGSAAVAANVPSDQYVAPQMNLDPPAAAPAASAE